MEKSTPAPFARQLPEPLVVENATCFDAFVTECNSDGSCKTHVTNGVLTSDDPNFHGVMEQVSLMFLNPVKRSASGVQDLLIILNRHTKSARIYINAPSVYLFHFDTMRPISVGGVLYNSDFALLHDILFPNINIAPDESVIVCLRHEFKFVLCFDFDRTEALERLQQLLALHYRKLLFEREYRFASDPQLIKAMADDGWFPFLEIAGSAFRKLFDVYLTNPPHAHLAAAEVVKAFDKERIEHIARRWWKNPLLNSKQPILEAGLEQFLQNTASGNINCIKTLASEIDGVLELKHFQDGQHGTKKRVSVADRVEYLHKLGSTKYPGIETTLLPTEFKDYLTNVVFKGFDLHTGDMVMSRNLVGHGVAEASAYTRERALQMILTIDQIVWQV